MTRHKCYGGRNGWQTCTACDGRIHHKGCTAKMDKRKDCCPERHEMLRAQGHITGIYDNSVEM